MTRWILRAALLMFCLVPLLAWSQQQAKAPEPQRPKLDTYRLVFAVNELEGERTVNSRSYDMVLQEASPGINWGNIRIGNRVPVNAGDKGTQYTDVGLSIDCGLSRRDETGPSLSTRFELSSLASEQSAAPNLLPVMRSIRFSSQAELTAGKAIVLGTGDDPASKRRYQLVVTATRLK